MCSHEVCDSRAIASETLKKLLEHPPVEAFDRRAERRYPLFCPVTLRSTDLGTEPHYAMSRELSATGIGLILGKSLSRGEVYELELMTNGQILRKRVEIIWCREVHNGWFQSGCRFL